MRKQDIGRKMKGFLFTPRVLEWRVRANKKNSFNGCFLDFCLGSADLEVAEINAKLPDMPNAMADDHDVLHYIEEKGEEKGEVVYSVGGYLVARESLLQDKVVGCLNFSLNIHYNFRNLEMRAYLNLHGVCVNPYYRRRYIASYMGILIGKWAAETIAGVNALLMPSNGRIVMLADFNHEGGEACFNEMESQVETLAATMFQNLEVNSDAGW